MITLLQMAIVVVSDAAPKNVGRGASCCADSVKTAIVGKKEAMVSYEIMHVSQPCYPIL